MPSWYYIWLSMWYALCCLVSVYYVYYVYYVPFLWAFIAWNNSYSSILILIHNSTYDLHYSTWPGTILNSKPSVRVAVTYMKYLQTEFLIKMNLLWVFSFTTFETSVYTVHRKGKTNVFTFVIISTIPPKYNIVLYSDPYLSRAA